MQLLTRLARPVLTRTSLPIRYVQSPRLNSSNSPHHEETTLTNGNLCSTFTTLSPLRPSLSSSAIGRPNAITSFTPTTASNAETATTPADVVPRGAISAHPALGGASQMRCGPRNTMNGATRLVQKRRHGWLVRMRSRTGRKILQRRKLKGRRKVAW
jgi:large subunit ribosomal protein L34